jgi:hypothetical protein
VQHAAPRSASTDNVAQEASTTGAGYVRGRVADKEIYTSDIREFAVEPPGATRWLIQHAVLGGYVIWWLFGCLLVMVCIECLLPY